MNYFMLMMGGSGTRYGMCRPKQYIEVNNKPIFLNIVERCYKADCVDKIILVSNGQWMDYVYKWMRRFNRNKSVIVVEGGNSRSESIKNGLYSIKDEADRTDVVLIHDATHPYFTEMDIIQLIKAVEKYGAGTLGQKLYDTVYHINNNGFLDSVLPREMVVSGASPEAFQYGLISDIYFNADETELSNMTSAGAIALAHGISMKVIPFTGFNLKITYPEDMELFKLLMETYFFKGEIEDDEPVD